MKGYMMIRQNLFKCEMCFEFSVELKFHSCMSICLKCIEKIDDEATCEICEKPLKKGNIKSYFVSNFIPDKMSCVNKELGCKWTGTKFDLGSHINFCNFSPLLTNFKFIEVNEIDENITGSFRIDFNQNHIYIGDVVNGKKQGKGHEYKNRNIYIGEFKDNEYCGQGELQYENRSSYKGEFAHGKRNGKGVYYGIKEDIYRGEWKDDLRDGVGVYSCKPMYVYRGGWQAGKKHGEGLMILGSLVVDVKYKNDELELVTTKIVSANGDIYIGEFNKNFHRNGFGRMDFVKGGFYEGFWKNNAKNGIGKIPWKNDLIEEGLFEDDKLLKIFKLSFDDGTRFEGEYSIADSKGEGKLITKEGVYNGTVVGDFIREGFGIMNFANGNAYEGEWKDDIFHGQGKFQHVQDNYVYTGNIERGQKHGLGSIKFDDGTQYTGHWYKDKYADKGMLIQGDIKYDGFFKNNLYEGNGTLFFKGQEIYTGYFVGGVYDGMGVLKLQNGDKLSGTFREGFIDQKGKYVFKNGDIYTGEFKDDLMHGQGRYVYANGNIYVGEFDMGGFGAGTYYDMLTKIKYKVDSKSNTLTRIGKFDPAKM